MKFRQGDTFDYSGIAEFVDSAGDTLDLSTWTATASIRFPDARKTFDFDVTTESTAEGLMVRVRSTETASWPVGYADVQVQFKSMNDDIVSTDTARISVVKDVVDA